MLRVWSDPVGTRLGQHITLYGAADALSLLQPTSSASCFTCTPDHEFPHVRLFLSGWDAQ